MAVTSVVPESSPTSPTSKAKVRAEASSSAMVRVPSVMSCRSAPPLMVMVSGPSARRSLIGENLTTADAERRPAGITSAKSGVVV